jgi:hypothetical protein
MVRYYLVTDYLLGPTTSRIITLPLRKRPTKYQLPTDPRNSVVGREEGRYLLICYRLGKEFQFHNMTSSHVLQS